MLVDEEKDLAGRLARWSLQIQEYNIEIVHRSGRLHLDADALSRCPVGGAEAVVDLPMLWVDFPEGVETSDLRATQLETPWLVKIMDGLKLNPSRTTRKYIRPFILKNNILYRRSIVGGRAFDRLCFPQSLVQNILLTCHDDVTAGHLGTTRTLHKIRQRFFWPRMTK